MNHRPLSRRHAATTIGRSSRALLAFAVSAGMAFQAGAHPVKAEEDNSVEGYLSELVGQASQTEKEVSSLQLQVGGLRESANKARVDLNRAQTKAQKAQDEVLSARDRLKSSDKEVASAQGKLDDIARSAYTQGGDASPIPMAAGKDAASSALDRSTYIRMAAEKQRAKVDRLDLARTQNANHESGLRTNRESANRALQAAVQAHKAAADAMTRSISELRGKQQKLVKLLQEHKKAQAKLRAARSAVDALANSKPNATSWEKRRVAEAAADGAQATKKPALPKSGQEGSQQKSKNSSAITGYSAKSNGAKTGQQQPEGMDPTDKSGEANNSAEPSAPVNSGAPSAAAEAKATNEDKAENAAPAAESSTEQAPLTGPQASLPTGSSLPQIPENFAASSAGDDQRQEAIDGLMKAGQSALMAGFTNYAQKGDRNSALQAAMNAGRESAGNAYDEHLKRVQQAQGSNGAQNNASSQNNTETQNETEGTTPTAPQLESGTTEDPTAPGATDGNTEGTTPGGTAEQDPGNADDSVDTSGTAEEKIERVIKRGESQMGVTYAWGGGNQHGPTMGIRDGGVADSFGDYTKVGFDCSGLMMYAFAAAGVQLEHYSGYQYTAGKQVPVSEAKRGDMLFWGPGGSQHVALYLGDNKMLEAPQSGDVVKVSDVRWAGIEPMAVRMIE